jgi:hypothetical protein
MECTSWFIYKWIQSIWIIYCTLFLLASDTYGLQLIIEDVCEARVMYNLDVMYTKKNVFENIFNTVIDVKGKTKDNMEIRMNIHLFCHHKNMDLVYNKTRVVKPKVSFALDFFVY